MVTTRKMVLDAAWELIGEQYTAGASIDALAAQHRVSRHSMTEGLKARGLFIVGRKNKPPRSRCKRDHDLAVHGRQLMKRMPDGSFVRNGRECMECKRSRQRVA